MSNRKKQTARHDGRILDAGSREVNEKITDLGFEAPSLLEAWFALRGASIPKMAELADVDHTTIYNLLREPERARPSTLDAIAAAARKLTGSQVRELAFRRLRNPDRANAEIDAALARAS